FLTQFPEEFADISVYNASLDNKNWITSKTDFICSRGYFSHSASNATLSDILVPSSESMDHLDFYRQCNKPSKPHRKKCLDKVSHCTTDKAAALLFRSASCYSVDSPTYKTKVSTVHFLPCEVAVEHTCAILEDHSFTEFMGAEDGKDLEQHEHSLVLFSNGDKDRAECNSLAALPNATPIVKGISDFYMISTGFRWCFRFLLHLVLSIINHNIIATKSCLASRNSN
uniref:Uncharacterized protein n=1 Tax=Xenopus tropicalis TaxID=8364 RepID=A0A6I8Q416_XENTR